MGRTKDVAGVRFRDGISIAEMLCKEKKKIEREDCRIPRRSVRNGDPSHVADMAGKAEFFRK